jgi:hypothetical protein
MYLVLHPGFVVQDKHQDELDEEDHVELMQYYHELLLKCVQNDEVVYTYHGTDCHSGAIVRQMAAKV